MKELFPEGPGNDRPVVEDGFYYDYSFQRPFTPEDLAAIENQMREIAKRDLPLERQMMPRDAAVKFFSELGERYKAEIIASIPEGEQISLYRQNGFVDLCRGPHVPSTGKLKVFKLMKVVGAYWRGLEERDAAADLRHGLDEEGGPGCLPTVGSRKRRSAITASSARSSTSSTWEEAPGMVFWHPNGWVIWQQVEQYMRRVYASATTAISRCAALRSSTAACGRSRATGRTTRS